MDPQASAVGLPSYAPQSIRVGDWRVTALCDGYLRLDGGSMWGVVPAALWRQLTPPAADNTIALALRPFLVERGDVKCVIEVGIGNRWDAKLRSIYSIVATVSLEQSLRACGTCPDEITHVVASHRRSSSCSRVDSGLATAHSTNTSLPSAFPGPQCRCRTSTMCRSLPCPRS